MSEWLNAITAATSVYRKGPEVTKRDGVVSIWGYPHADEIPEGLPVVDLHFVKVAVDPLAADNVQHLLMNWLAEYPDQDRLHQGLSYIEFAGVGGIEQETALQLFALGQVLGLWTVITPELLGFEGGVAHEFARSGLVMYQCREAFKR